MEKINLKMWEPPQFLDLIKKNWELEQAIIKNNNNRPTLAQTYFHGSVSV